MAANEYKVNETTSIYLPFIHHYLKSFVSSLLYNSEVLHYLRVMSDVRPLPMLFEPSSKMCVWKAQKVQSQRGFFVLFCFIYENIYITYIILDYISFLADI